MLYITGILNGQTYDQQQISAAEVAKAFGVPTMGNYAEFRLTDAHVSRKPDGQINNLNGMSLKPRYNIQLPGGAIELRYATSRTMDPATRNWKYMVDSLYKMMDFRGELLVFSKAEQAERYVWYFLHPAQGNNKFRDSQKPAMFYYYDREGESAVNNERSIMLTEAIAQIAGMDFQSLKVLASGIEYKINGVNRVVPRINESGEQELRNSLINLAMNDKHLFVAAFRNGGNTLAGQLRLAVDAGLIRIDRQTWGINWMWNAGTHQDTPIVSVRKNEDEFAALQGAFTENHGDLMPLLADVLKQQRLSALAEKQQGVEVISNEDVTLEYVKSLGADKLVQYAVLNEMVGVDRQADAVSFIDANGDFEDGGQIFHPIQKRKWQPLLVQLLSSAQAKQSREVFVQRVFAHMLSAQTPATLAPKPGKKGQPIEPVKTEAEEMAALPPMP